ncbi:MAG: hypothetical protein Aurels2KO_41580 [Aureliella sp.]
MPAHFHLRDFLATGDFLGFGGETTRADVEFRLGPPDYYGLVSRKHKLPRIWGYGGIELTFGSDATSPLELIHFDHPNLPPAGSDCITITPWILTENLPFDLLATACRDAGIGLISNTSALVPFWSTTGNVRLYFGDEPPDTGLVAVSRVFRGGGS